MARGRTDEPEIIQEPAGALVRLDPQRLIAQAVTANANIETVEKLVALAERVSAAQAKAAWHAAMAEFQAECPPIPKSRTAKIPLRSGGSFSYSYAALQDLLRFVRPVMAKHGLTARWGGTKVDAVSVTLECLIAHRLGHVESSGAVTLPIASADEGRGMSAPQRASASMTYAKRVSLVNGLGLSPDDEVDTDGGPGEDEPAPGGTVTPITEADRPTITASAARLADERKLTTEERLELTKTYLHGQPLNKASVVDLRRLEFFLGDVEAVAQWRADRERELEK
jgi:hypothetical protein